VTGSPPPSTGGEDPASGGSAERAGGSPERAGGSAERSDVGEDRVVHRLDPDRAAAAAGGPRGVRSAIDTRRYQWTVGALGIALVIAFSIYLFAKNGVVSPGIPAGRQIYRFVAPLATGELNGDATTHPHCNPAAPLPQALNVCGLGPLVLDFFVTGSSACKDEVGTMQRVSREFPGIQFAAVAVRGSHHDTAALVRSRRWTIPVAYDRDGAIGSIYGVEICPMIELVRPGGLVAARLIGEKWLHPDDLSAQVREKLG
jgi:hypothetical protein